MANRIVKIHGCSGAGKTTLVRNLMATGEVFCHSHANGEVYYLLMSGPTPIYILGNYENNCGGCDTIDASQKVMDMIDDLAPSGHVILEGLLQSTYYGAMGTHSQKYGDRYVYAFLDTPLSICLERVVKRRAERGTTRALNPDLTRRKHETIARLRGKLIARGDHVVIDISSRDGHETVLRTLGEEYGLPRV